MTEATMNEDTRTETKTGTKTGPKTDPSTESKADIHQGGCHCGAVRFQVEARLGEGAARCNCSVCTKIAATAQIVKPAAFRLLSSEEALGSYQWGAKISRRFFCKHCGIHCFGRGFLAEVGGDYVSVNLNCLDAVDPGELPVMYWDGRHNNWDAGPRPNPWPI